MNIELSLLLLSVVVHVHVHVILHVQCTRRTVCAKIYAFGIGHDIYSRDLIRHP